MARKRPSSTEPAPPLPQGGGETPADAGSEGSPVEVTLLKPHTHGDRDYAVGDKLTVRPPVAQWLRERGVVAPTSGDPA